MPSSHHQIVLQKVLTIFIAVNTERSSAVEWLGSPGLTAAHPAGHLDFYKESVRPTDNLYDLDWEKGSLSPGTRTTFEDYAQQLDVQYDSLPFSEWFFAPQDSDLSKKDKVEEDASVVPKRGGNSLQSVGYQLSKEQEASKRKRAPEPLPGSTMPDLKNPAKLLRPHEGSHLSCMRTDSQTGHLPDPDDTEKSNHPSSVPLLTGLKFKKTDRKIIIPPRLPAVFKKRLDSATVVDSPSANSPKSHELPPSENCSPFSLEFFKSIYKEKAVRKGENQDLLYRVARGSLKYLNARTLPSLVVPADQASKFLNDDLYGLSSPNSSPNCRNSSSSLNRQPYLEALKEAMKNPTIMELIHADGQPAETFKTHMEARLRATSPPELSTEKSIRVVSLVRVIFLAYVRLINIIFFDEGSNLHVQQISAQHFFDNFWVQFPFGSRDSTDEQLLSNLKRQKNVRRAFEQLKRTWRNKGSISGSGAVMAQMWHVIGIWLATQKPLLLEAVIDEERNNLKRNFKLFLNILIRYIPILV